MSRARVKRLERAAGASADLPWLIVQQEGDTFRDRHGNAYTPEALRAIQAADSHNLLIWSYGPQPDLLGNVQDIQLRWPED